MFSKIILAIVQRTPRPALYLSLVFLLSNCAVIQEFQTTTSEIEFRQRAVDRNLSWPGGFDVRFTSDGKITGTFPQGQVNGTWQWINGKFCRSLQAGIAIRPYECLIIEFSQNQIRFKRENGEYFLPYVIAEKS